jgi:hypothetical protein
MLRCWTEVLNWNSGDIGLIGLRKAETIGRPVGDAAFLAALERESGRPLAPARRGRKAAKSALSP